VLAGVTGARHPNFRSLEGDFDDMVSLRHGCFSAKQGPTQFCCARTLNGHGAKLRAAVHEAAGRGALPDAARALGKLLLLEMLLEPTEIFLCASGVDHEQKRLLGGSV